MTSWKTLLVVDGTCSLNGSLPFNERAMFYVLETVQHSYNVSGNNSCRVLAMSATFDESGPRSVRALRRPRVVW
jgi:hypothetical protein